MSSPLVVILNILYLAGACLLLKYLKLPFIRFNTWSYTWAVLFIASILFTIGLFLFDIPFMLGSMDSESIERAKSEWWIYPFFPFLALVVGLGFRVILGYIRGRLHREKSKFHLFLAACSITTCLMTLFIISWFQDPDLSTPEASEYFLFTILWLIGVGFFFFGSMIGKAAFGNVRKVWYDPMT